MDDPAVEHPAVDEETGNDPDAERAREAALRMLDRARRTRHELARRLGEKGFAAPVVAQALDRLARVGLVDDVEYARAFVRAKLARRAVGLRVLESQLRARGVSDADRARALADLDAEAAREEAAHGSAEAASELAAWRGGGAGERARAERALAPLRRRWRALDPREARTRATAALLRRGFDWTVVREVLDSTSSPGREAEAGAGVAPDPDPGP